MVEGQNNARIPLTYGMYAPYGGFLRNSIENPDQTVILAETSNFGATGVFNPQPFPNLEGAKIPHDGFVIAWDDSNLEPSDKSSYVTRLAFPNTSGGVFAKDGAARHDAGLHAITASGAASPLLKPQDAKVERRFKGDLPSGMWAAPPISRRR